MTREKAAGKVIAECFWGDYTLTANDLLDGLENGDAAFHRFIFSKIVDHARFPSALIRALFTPQEVRRLLEATARQPRWSDLRHRLIRANLTGETDLVPERQWRT